MASQAVQKFKFVSPGIWASETDQTTLPKEGGDIGPLVIGRLERGPAMRPVKVNSFAEFVEIFGNPVPGGQGGDVWRDGNYLAPTYAAYAAQAWLKNASPLNVVRLLGDEHSEAVEAGYNGWKAGVNEPDPVLGDNGGAFGLFVGQSGSAVDGDIGNMCLAAVFYLTEGAIRLQGPTWAAPSGASITGSGGAAGLIMNVGDNYGFKAVIEDGSGAEFVTASFNFSRSSTQYIRKVFSTNPTLTNSTITDSDNVKTYWLGETFDRFLMENITTGSIGKAIGCILALDSQTWTGHDFRMGTKAPRSGWVISQDLTDNTGSYDPRDMTKLFRFRGLENGEWDQRKLKISIKNIQASSTDLDPYGTFTVEVREASDSDGTPKVLEQFSSCNLNPASTNYLAVKIGDSYSLWSDTDRRYRYYGNYANKSKFVRVEMNSDVEAGAVDPRLLPFGFYGPPRFTMPDDAFESGSGIQFAGADPVRGSGSMPYCTNTGDDISGCPTPFICSFLFPSLPLRTTTVDGSLSSPKRAYWGADSTRLSDATRFEESYSDLVRTKPLGVDGYDEDADDQTSASFIFSLDDVAWASGSTTDAEYAAGNRALAPSTGSSITAGTYYDDTGAIMHASASYELVLNAEFNRFTMPLYGGFDGLNIREEEPFRNSQWTGTVSETTNGPYYSIKKAIDACADAEVIEYNVLTMPGLTHAGLTSHILTICEARGDALGIIDLEGGYVPGTENNSDPEDNVGDVATTVNELKSRGLNTSYGCAYYPWVQIKDSINGACVWVPPSVVALGTMASGERKSELWFAPAGFTRGGLTQGAAGLQVINVRDKLSADDRDKLYQYAINPIAQFPNEGIVVYGQKTLQATPSALDRINVRRMLIYVKKQISRMAAMTLFDQNVEQTWARFTSDAVPFLRSVQARLGITNFKFILDSSTTTPDLVDRNILYAKILLKPARAIEYICLDFVLTDSGAAFTD
jgi:hypothetical protein